MLSAAVMIGALRVKADFHFSSSVQVNIGPKVIVFSLFSGS